MSPETTRVSLESTVDILIRRPEQQNCIQCKSKKENQKRQYFPKKMIKRKKRTSRGFNDDQISDIKPMLLFSRNNSCRCCSCRYNSCGRGQRSAQASERSEYSPTSISQDIIMSRLVCYLFIFSENKIGSMKNLLMVMII